MNNVLARKCLAFWPGVCTLQQELMSGIIVMYKNWRSRHDCMAVQILCVVKTAVV